LTLTAEGIGEITDPAQRTRDGFVSKIERGLHEPAWPLVQALARALDVTCAAFDVPAGEAPAPPGPQPRGRPRLAEAPGAAGASPKGKAVSRRRSK
jgi:hypothetical protein